jgi:hypothetical protein
MLHANERRSPRLLSITLGGGHQRRKYLRQGYVVIAVTLFQVVQLYIFKNEWKVYVRDEDKHTTTSQSSEVLRPV